MLPRDNQRQRVYNAESVALPSRPRLGTTVAEVQAWVNKITDYAWFRRRWGRRNITVVQKRGSGGYVYNNSTTIHIGLNVQGGGAYQSTVIHEIAHVLVPQERHGPMFARTMVELTRYTFGAYNAANLLSAYRTYGARVGSPTPMRVSVPEPRPIPLTWRASFRRTGTHATEVVVLQALSARGALAKAEKHLTGVDNVTEIRVWKSRAVKAASPARRG
jgi:putative metallohydrolase (TIGR04338 family)